MVLNRPFIVIMERENNLLQLDYYIFFLEVKLLHYFSNSIEAIV